MPKASRDSLNAKGKRDCYMFDPEDLVLVTDDKSPLYDERINLPVDEALVLNIMFVPNGGSAPQGVIEPVNGMRNTETGKVEIIDGRQRIKAAREANKRLKKQGLEPIWVPCMLKKTTGHGAMGMLISSNEIRQDDTPLGRAKKMQRYIDYGRDEAEVAILFGVSKPSVKNLLSLLDAPAAVRNAVEAGQISTSDGYKLAKLEPSDANKKVAELKEHAPRVPGKKRSKNAGKAREIVHGTNGKANGNGVSKKAENAVAVDIAAWIDQTWKDVPGELLKKLRAGEWRSVRG